MLKSVQSSSLIWLADLLVCCTHMLALLQTHTEVFFQAKLLYMPIFTVHWLCEQVNSAQGDLTDLLALSNSGCV